MPRQVDTDVVEWEDPPNRVRYDWEAIARKLERKPMAWGVVFRQDRVSVANAIRQGSIARVHADLGFEVRTANNTADRPRRCDLYLRYNPDLDERRK